MPLLPDFQRLLALVLDYIIRVASQWHPQWYRPAGRHPSPLDQLDHALDSLGRISKLLIGNEAVHVGPGARVERGVVFPADRDKVDVLEQWSSVVSRLGEENLDTWCH